MRAGENKIVKVYTTVRSKHLYQQWDLNPHGACAPTDFKSVASTIPPCWQFGAGFRVPGSGFRVLKTETANNRTGFLYPIDQNRNAVPFGDGTSNCSSVQFTGEVTLR